MAYAPYTSNPTADAERYYDAMDAEAAKREQDEIRIGNEITETLTKHIRVTTSLTVPSVHFSNGSKVSQTPITEVISDEIGFGKPFEALMEALQKSDCLYVQAIREAIAKSYADANAADIAEVAE